MFASALRRVIPLTLILLSACSDETRDYSDKTRPKVLSVSPKDGSTDISVNTAITVRFSEAILYRKKLKNGFVEEFDFSGFSVKDPDGNEAAGFLSFNNDTITFRGTAALKYSTKYTVSVNDRIKDLFGNRARPHAWSFETEADQVAPSEPYNLTYTPISKSSPVVLSGAKEIGSTVRLNGTAIDAPKDAAEFQISLPLAEGANSFVLDSVDDAGNASSQVTVNITLDTIRPASLLRCPNATTGTGLQWHAGNRSGCWNPPTKISWNNSRLPLGAQWSPGTDEVAYFELGTQRSPGFTANSFEYGDFNLDLVQNQTVTLRAVSYDSAGNETVAFSRQFVFDTQAPTLQLISSAPSIFSSIGLPATQTTATSVTLTYEKPEAAASFSAALDGVTVPANCAGINCTASFTLPQGPHVVTATATDGAGNATVVRKTITVDSQEPTALVVPPNGGASSTRPTFYVFASEPVTAGELTVASQSFAGTSEATFNGRMWSFDIFPVMLSAGLQNASVTLFDKLGNTKTINWSFTAGGTVSGDPATYSTATVSPSGLITVNISNSAPVHLLTWREGAAYGMEATSSATIQAKADRLIWSDAILASIDSDGQFTGEAPLPSALWDTPMQHDAPVDQTFVGLPYYATSLPMLGDPTQGFVFYTDVGRGYAVAGNSVVDEEALFTCTAGYPSFPMVPLSGGWALEGRPCLGGPSRIAVRKTSDAGFPGTPAVLWQDLNDINFGASLAAAEFFADGNTQVVVGAPSSTGKVYLYASTAATTPLFTFEGDTSVNNAHFGSGVAFAANHHNGHNTLAVLADGEPAVYFYDDIVYTEAATDPVPKYRARVGLDPVCVFQSNDLTRYELINPGDIDADGREDLAVAAWGDGGSCGSVVDFKHVTSGAVWIFFAGNDVAPLRINTTYGRVALEERPRLIAAGDLNGDGYDDLAFVDRKSDNVLQIIQGGLAGTLLNRNVSFGAPDSGEHWILGGAQDSNADGYNELILLRSSGQRLQAWP